MGAQMIATHDVMEEGGFYNLHAKIPAGGGSLALPYSEKAAQACTPRPGSDPILIADYGSSQGKNSLVPMRAAIRCLRTRVGNERAIVVANIDQHANDFNTLFDVLHADRKRYSLVFPSAIGRSFYECSPSKANPLFHQRGVTAEVRFENEICRTIGPGRWKRTLTYL